MITKDRKMPGQEIELKQGSLVYTAHLHSVLLFIDEKTTPPHEKEYLTKELIKAIGQMKTDANWFEEELKKRELWTLEQVVSKR